MKNCNQFAATQIDRAQSTPDNRHIIKPIMHRCNTIHPFDGRGRRGSRGWWRALTHVHVSRRHDRNKKKSANYFHLKTNTLRAGSRAMMEVGSFDGLALAKPKETDMQTRMSDLRELGCSVISSSSTTPISFDGVVVVVVVAVVVCAAPYLEESN